MATCAKRLAPMNYYFIGRVGKIRLSPSNALNPIFEAVINSINAIRDANITGGRIAVHLERTPQSQTMLDGGTDLTPIQNVTIRDNGVGFTEKNYYSFSTPDFSYKPAAKGVGRLLWLIAFNEAHIESRYSENGKNYLRKFDFVLTPEGIEKPTLEETEDRKRETEIRLVGFKPKYQAECEKRLDTIADKLVEHCLFYLTQPSCPTIILSDTHPDSQPINLNQLYRQGVTKTTESQPFQVKDVAFGITNLQLRVGGERKHKIYFCANERPVRHIADLSKRIPDLGARPILDDHGTFRYSAYISSDYLTERVNEERTGFAIDRAADDEQGTLAKELTWDEIEREAINQARLFLDPYLISARQDKIAKIKRYISVKAPQYRPILTYRPQALERFKSNQSEAEMDAALREVLFEIETEMNERTRQVLSKTPESLGDLEVYRAQYDQLVETVNDISKSQLAHYVIHRKLMLDLLEKALHVKEGGEYSKEDRIHQMVYPMGTTSGEISYEQQNLWIIDERLNYHQFLASDKQLRTTPNLDTKSHARPDIVIFGGESDVTYSNVVLVEFKRPMRDDLSSEDKDPIKQLLGYTKLIESGQLKDQDGRKIPVHSATRYYCYLICDINEQIKYHAGANDLVPAPDEMAFFGYKSFFRSYIEVTDYNKLVEDAKKRNKAFIQKLNLPVS